MKKNLPSEQIPNDGGYYWHIFVEQANDRLKQIGKHGKRATIKVNPKPGKPISAQFSLNGKQTQRGLNLSLNKPNLAKAEEVCTLITSQLVANTFNDDWLDSLLGKEKPVEIKKVLTCGEMLETYKKHYFKQRQKNKIPVGTWLGGYRYVEKIFNLYSDKLVNLQIIREIIDCTENNTHNRKNHLNGLANLLNYFDNKDFKQVIKKYKKENNPKLRNKYIPSDREVAYIYFSGFSPKKNCPKKFLDKYPQWQFLYGLLTVYGLRIHEAWNIKNWDKPVVFKNGDYIAIVDDTDDTESENEDGKLSYHQIKKDLVIPAILDPDNKEYLLCVGHETKTGHRIAFPICPSGHTSSCEWIKTFNLIQPLNLPEVKNPLGRNGEGGAYNCSCNTTRWFRRHGYGFTPHSLRHAYNIRGHNLGVNQKALANALGHGLRINSSNYLRHEREESRLQALQNEIKKDSAIRDKVKNLKLKLERLEDENKYLNSEVERLKTELKMYRMLENKN